MDILRNPAEKYRPILKHEVLTAQENARSAAEAARILGISYTTYKKYAKMYGIHTFINKAGKGISKPKVQDNQYPMVDIFAGKFPNYNLLRLKMRLINGGFLAEKCCLCGFDERRITDNKIPLLLTFKDNNKHHHALENMELKCFNCAFLTIGNLNRIRTIIADSGKSPTISHEESHLQSPEVGEWIKEAQKELTPNENISG